MYFLILPAYFGKTLTGISYQRIRQNINAQKELKCIKDKCKFFYNAEKLQLITQFTHQFSVPDPMLLITDPGPVP